MKPFTPFPVADIQEVLYRVSYRPGWTFRVEMADIGPRLRIVTTVPDSYHPGKMIDLGVDSWLPPFAGEEEFLRWLAWRLRMIEIHESQEWLKVDGAPYDDPHQEQS